jgi:cell wall-associated NlpC family hydrolase
MLGLKNDINHGQRYVLGNEPFDGIDIIEEPSSDPLAGDCSGLMISLWRRANVLLDGKTYNLYFGTYRPIANSMYRKATKIAQPSKFGDMFFLLRDDGRAKHVGMYIGTDKNGVGWTIEFGDGTGKVGRHTVEWQNQRRAVWGRIPNDMGERTPVANHNIPDVDWPSIKLFSRNTQVRELKALLNITQGSTLDIYNNYYGYSVYREVKRFKANHVGPNGEKFVGNSIVGPMMRWALAKAIAAR